MGIWSTIGSVAGSYFGGPTGGVVGGSIGSYLDQDQANKNASSNADIAYERQRELRRTAYQDTMEDLSKAGLNPMLAFSQGPTSASSVAAPQFQNVSENSPSYTSYQNSASSASQAESSAKTAASYKDVAEENVIQIQNEVVNIKVEGNRLLAAIKLLDSQARLALKQGDTQDEVLKQTQATILLLHKQAKMLGFDISATEALDNVGRKAGQLKPIIDIVRGLFSAGRSASGH